ncbi:DUF3311 domain-containing protein [Kineosporia sp. R_H_3]|uniref:DUF3311 domain-containing protein n=1 Tax=Kineosporia sp. R_H_3 TaxID=1961848 RepID=UPI000B4B3510|nr:DUF3311 domain-containing protein [Kineosporia sp. R_H_3]
MTDVPDDVTAGRRDRSSTGLRTGWLLLLPLLLVVYPPLYNRTDPDLFGIPFFYWYQLAVIPVSVVCTTVVYLTGRRTRRGSTR